MGSLMENADPTPSNPIVPKSESVQDGYTSSSVSTPEADIGPITQDVVQVQKRKGGRKPIYATSEERKQRNRQAQAAFRERRTEYIKQLENTIKHHEDALQNLQQSHRSAADECLMLRYKNSLLERILLEKGINVQEELRMKSSPHLGPTKAPPTTNNSASPIQGAMMNWQQAARSNSTSAVPPLQPINTVMQSEHKNVFSSYPSPYPQSSVQTSSPSNSRPSGSNMQGALSSPTSNFTAQQMHQQQRHYSRQPRNSFIQHCSAPRPTSSASAHPPGPISDQEFEPHAEIIDDAPRDDAVTDQFIPNFRLHNVPMSLQGQPPPPAPNMADAGGGPFGPGHHSFDPYDPMLDADPFGLSASMHFPTPYTYDPQQNRR